MLAELYPIREWMSNDVTVGSLTKNNNLDLFAYSFNYLFQEDYCLK